MSDDNEQLRAKSARVTAERDEARAELLRRTAECDEVRARGRELRREVEALAVERDALREALATQAAAVRQLDVARTARHDADARDAETLRRRQQAPGDVLAEIAAVREEARMWNARATELEGERDALRSELDAMRLRWEYASGALEDLSRGCSEALSPRMSFDATRPAREIVERITAVVAERDALRAIVEGRTTLPSDAEALAHDEAHGQWLVVGLNDQGSTMAAMFGLAVTFVDPSVVLRVYALGHDKRLCAWPVVEVSRG